MTEYQQNLRIKKSETQHPKGELWTHWNPHEKHIFQHFTGGSSAILCSEVPVLVSVAGAHGWTVTVTKDPDEN